jgi:hypothetical protein
MLVRVFASLLFLVLLWWLFRLALGLRQAKLDREGARVAEEARGRRVVAELPPRGSETLFLLEDGPSFRWGRETVDKADIAGARLLVNGGVLQEFASGSTRLPPLDPPQEFEGGELWEVVVYRYSGGRARIPCGALREGVSREIAGRAFAAIRAATPKDVNAP